MSDPTAPRPDVPEEVPARHDRLAAAMLTPLIHHGLREAVKWVMEPEILAIEAVVEQRVREKIAREIEANPMHECSGAVMACARIARGEGR